MPDRFPLSIKALALVGPTAVGKTALSFAIAERFGAEIVSVDSMQVFRHMDIGTAKPTREEQGRVPHHCIDIADPDEDYTAGRYRQDAVAALEDINSRGKLPLLVGGTGLYLKTLVSGLFDIPPVPEAIRQEGEERLVREGLAALYQYLQEIDPETATRLHPHDRQRILRGIAIFQATGTPWSAHLARQSGTPVLADACIIGLACDRELLYHRINARVRQMVDQGLLDEVRQLLAMGYQRELKSMQSIGYRHMTSYLADEWSWEETVSLLARDTRRYAKRQLTWFAGMPEIRWIPAGSADDAARLVESFLAGGMEREGGAA